MQTPEPGEMIRELLAKKQALQMELRQRAATGSGMYYGSRLAVSLMTSRSAARLAFAAGPGLLVSFMIVVDGESLYKSFDNLIFNHGPRINESPGVRFYEMTQVYCAIVFAEGVFEGETLVTHPSRPQGELEIALYPTKNDPVDIFVKVYVGPPNTDLLQVSRLLFSCHN